MSGVPGRGGPPPKRDSQRRRAAAPAGGPAEKAPAGVPASPPDVDPRWHPVAVRWYESLALSGQSAFYESSDWATAFLVAESISRDLSPQPIGVTESGEVVLQSIPLKGASLQAYLKAFTQLLVTEGERRRARIELERSSPQPEDTSDVSWIDDARRRLRGSAG